MLLKTAVAFSLSLAASVRADPTWPAATDEIEEIMYQLYGSGARLFADTIFNYHPYLLPCAVASALSLCGVLLCYTCLKEVRTASTMWLLVNP